MWGDLSSDSKYDHFLHLTPQTSRRNDSFMECAGGQDKASEIEFRLVDSGENSGENSGEISGGNVTSTFDTYNLVDAATGKYIFQGDGYWVEGGCTNQSHAMPIQLVPNGVPTPGSDWGYCTSKFGVPEQVSNDKLAFWLLLSSKFTITTGQYSSGWPRLGRD